MKLKTSLYGIALFASASLLVISCKKSDVNVNESPTVTTERKFGVMEDDPKMLTKVPVIISSDFMTKKKVSVQESILNQLRTNPVKGDQRMIHHHQL